MTKKSSLIKDDHTILIAFVEELLKKREYNSINSNTLKVSLNFDLYIKQYKYCFLSRHKSFFQRSLNSVIQEGCKMVSQCCFKIMIKFHQLQRFFSGQKLY